MRPTILRAVLFLAVAGLAGAAPASRPAAAGSPLEGTRWKIKVSPGPVALKYNEHEFDDEIVFSDKKVSMPECMKYGFAASDYKIQKAADHWTFKRKSDSPAFEYTFEGKKEE